MRKRKPPYLGKGEKGWLTIYPQWPWGAVALLMPIKTAEGANAVRIRKVELQSVVNTRDGYKLYVGPGYWAASEYRVDHDGISANCVPWDDEIEAQAFPEPKSDADRVRETLERMRGRERRKAEEQEDTWGEVDRKAEADRKAREAAAAELERRARESFKLREREVERNGHGS